MIQADLLLFLDKFEFDIYATMTPAKEVGGDFYDFFLIDLSEMQSSFMT